MRKALAFFLIWASATVFANDWPQWRGPNRDGRSTETGLLKSWPSGGPKLLRKATGLGSSFATIVTSGDRIFTMGEMDDSGRVIALNRADGKPLWSARIGKTGAPGWGNFGGPRSTPTADGDLLFAISQWGDFICVDAPTGQE